MARLALGEEGPVEEHVQTDDQRHHNRGNSGGQAVVDQHPHDAPVATEDKQPDEGERSPSGDLMYAGTTRIAYTLLDQCSRPTNLPCHPLKAHITCTVA